MIIDRDLPGCSIYYSRPLGREKRPGASEKIEWANSLREGSPTKACYIGQPRSCALLHVMFKV